MPDKVLSLALQEPALARFRLRFAGGGISRVVGTSTTGTAGAEDVMGGFTSVTISGIGRVVGTGGAGTVCGTCAEPGGETSAPAASWACRAWIRL